MKPTTAQLRELFPNGSDDFFAASASDWPAKAPKAPVPSHLPASLPPSAPKPAPAAKSPKTQRKRPSRFDDPSRLSDLESAYERAQADYQSSLAVMERHLRSGPLAAQQAEGRDKGKFLVLVTSYRRRLLDDDNLCEKYHVDCCRYAGFLPADDPSQARIITTQEKVRTAAEERTEIYISRLMTP